MRGHGGDAHPGAAENLRHGHAQGRGRVGAPDADLPRGQRSGCSRKQVAEVVKQSHERVRDQVLRSCQGNLVIGVSCISRVFSVVRLRKQFQI